MEKFLVIIGEDLYKIFEKEDDLDKYLVEYANNLRKKGYQNVDKWECEMRNYKYSFVYREWYPDFVLPICKDYLENPSYFIDLLSKNDDIEPNEED